MQPLRAFLRPPRRRTVGSVAGTLGLLALTAGIAAGALAADATPAALAASPAARPLALTGCPSNVPVLPWRVLRIGSRGPDVTALQHMLRGWSDINRFSVAADGIYGPRTAAAVRSFQRFRGLRIDGVVGPQTWGSLALTVVARGDGGGFVAAAQVELTKNEYPVAIDAIFGPQTEAAVRRAQCDLGLRVDGIVGPQTWRGLIPRIEE
jgi:peptidoglycan hydrolase-like protein with peptidoglycan-binding domain